MHSHGGTIGVLRSLSFLLLPFGVFYWMIPFLSSSTIGNDYQIYPIQQQMELMFAVKTGCFPLYVPGFSVGQSSSVLTLGQLYHPISLIVSRMPGYWDGRAVEWNSLFRLLSLGVTHLVVFRLLRLWTLGRPVAWLLSFLTVYNLRMLDLFRYGASCESWTGHLLLCSSIGFLAVKPTRWLGPLSIILSTYWLVCSGHPQMAYYGLAGAAVVTLALPSLLTVTGIVKPMGFRLAIGFWWRVGAFVFLGLLLSSAYTFPYYLDFATEMSFGLQRTYAWADGFGDTLLGTVNNFFLPLRSDVHGGFGGSSLLLLPVLLPLLRIARIKIPAIVWGLWLVFILIFLHMQGHRTPVHALVFKFLPMASSMRVAGRISMLLPFLFLLMFVWLFRQDAVRIGWLVRCRLMSPLSLLTLLAGGVILVFFSIPTLNQLEQSTLFSPILFRRIPISLEIYGVLLGLLALAALGLFAHDANPAPGRGWACCALVCLQTVLMIGHGTWVEPIRPTLTYDQMLVDSRRDMEYVRIHAMYTPVVARQIDTSSLEPFIAKIYGRCLAARDNDHAHLLLEEGRTPDEVILEGLAPGEIPVASDSAETGEVLKGGVNLVYNSFNRLIFDVGVSRPAFLGVAVPYTGRWLALVNGVVTQVHRANGWAHAIRLPQGRHQVEFRYWSPSAFWGVLVSFCTVCVIGTAIVFHAFSTARVRVTLSLVCWCAGMAGMMAWNQSLYSGRNLEASYHWTIAKPFHLPNLAYNKRTWTSSLLWPLWPHLYYGGRAVDGDVSRKSGFLTGRESCPWWKVDLYRSYEIGSVVLRESRVESGFNTRPLWVCVSRDGRNWVKVREVWEKPEDGPVRVTFDRGVWARFVMLRASQECLFALDEVEIYPPG